MYRLASLRAARERVGHLGATGCFSTSPRFSSTSVAKRSSGGGLFGWLTGGGSSSLPRLDSPLPGVVIPPPLPDFVEPGKTIVTTLPNKVVIASETSPTPAASVGLYVDCGSVYETTFSFGITHLLEKMAFKSTTNRSHLRVVREIEAIGGSISASVSREQMGYNIDALKTYVPQMVEVLVDCVRNPAFLDWEVNEGMQKVKAEIGEISNNPQGLLMEAIHSVGYSGALAIPLMASETAIDRLDSETLEAFVRENYTAPRMVLVASGVEHEDLLTYAQPLFGDLPNGPHPEEPKSVYVGGDYRCQAESSEQLTHVALAFEVPGGWRKEKEAIILSVLQALLGGGSSFSTGGPGKGMYSRLYSNVLNEFPGARSFSAFSSLYNNTGIFGIYATAGEDFLPKVVDIAARELHAVATPGQVTQAQLDRAKEATKAGVLMNLESRMLVAEDMGRQILTYGERKSVDHLLQTVNEVTLKDITSISEKLISSRPTMASWGDVIHLPSYESVNAKFHVK